MGKRTTFGLLIGVVLLLSLFPYTASHAQGLNKPLADDPVDMLIYKTYGQPGTDLRPLPAPCTGENCEADSIPYYKPYTAASTAAVGRSSLVEVTTPGMWPFSPTVKIYSHWPSGTTTTCSGMMVEAKFVLTAAHCVYSHLPANCLPGDSSCWVDDIEVVPAFQVGAQPFGESGYQTILTWTDWTVSQDSDFDLAAVQLRYPIGASIGWLGVGFNNDDSFFTNNVFTSTFYPELAPYDGEKMYGWSGTVDDSTGSDELLILDHGSDNGQLGSTLNGENGIVYGVTSFTDAGSQTGITRMTYSKFDSIRTFIQEGQPKSDPDLTVFDVHVGSKWNFPGYKLSDVDFYIQNYSNTAMPTDSHQIDIYLSADNIISDSDILLNAFTFEAAFEPNQGFRVTVPQEVALWLPEEIHGSEPNGGIFFVGVIVEPVVGEINTDNNRTDYYQPEPVWVNDSDNSNYSFPVFSR